jgi:simple sugar transport system permease protein
MTWLKQRYAVHEVMSGLLLSGTLIPLARAVAVAPSTPPALTFELSILTAPLRWAPGLGLPRHFVLAWGILILSLALALAAMLAHMLRASVRGFELRTVGSNPLAAFAAGVNVERVQMAMLMIGGACAGFAGALQLWTQPAVALERWPLPLALAGVSIVFFGLGSVRGIVASALLFAGWLNAPGTLAVLGIPVWGVTIAVLLILPTLWVLPRLLPDQGAPRSIWRTRHRDTF